LHPRVLVARTTTTAALAAAAVAAASARTASAAAAAVPPGGDPHGGGGGGSEHGGLRGDHHAGDAKRALAGDAGAQVQRAATYNQGCGNRNTCSDQAACFAFTDEPYCEGKDTGDCNNCKRKVCIDLKENCCDGNIDYVGVAKSCYDNKQCSSSSRTCTKKSDYGKWDAPICQVVDPGTVAKFVIKDGDGKCAQGGNVPGWTCGPNSGSVVSFSKGGLVVVLDSGTSSVWFLTRAPLSLSRQLPARLWFAVSWAGSDL
jgi:hypothetical protein